MLASLGNRTSVVTFLLCIKADLYFRKNAALRDAARQAALDLGVFPNFRATQLVQLAAELAAGS